VELERLPLTPNGKTDKKALPDPELTDVTVYVAPRNETEQLLADIWQELLGIERISVYDNFFELGGHSLLAMRVVSAIRKELNVELSIRDLFSHPVIAGLGAYLDQQNKGSELPAIIAGNRPEQIPLSFSQERLWFIDQLEGSVQYHIPAVLRLNGTVNPELLEKTFRAIIDRHEVLRTIIKEDTAGRGYQQILPVSGWSLTIEDYTKKDTAALESHIEESLKTPFDLSGDYMLRASLVKAGKEAQVLVVTMHHIASDGWSASILVKEIIEIYEAFTQQREAKLPILPVQYADYAVWQRNWLQGALLEEKLQYWKDKLDGVSPLELPTDYVRPSVAGISGANMDFSIGKELSGQLQLLSHGQGATLYMTLLSVFKVLLYRYSGQEDICVGTPVAGRQQYEVEGLIGFFVNTLALRSQVSGDMTFTELLEEIKGTTLEAYAHQEVPFEKVVDAVVKVRDMSRSPLFQVMFVFQNTPDIPDLRLGDSVFSLEETDYDASKYDLTFTLTEKAQGISGTIQYNTELYKAETIGMMLTHYRELLNSVISDPAAQIGQLGMLSAAEETLLLEDFNDTAAVYPKEKNIVSLIEEQVAKSPEATAVVFEEEQLSYKELNERSNQLARYLQKNGVKVETLVPICLERSLEMIVGIVGILKAGGVYVPIDPEYPADRISYMLEDAAATLVLSSSGSRDKLNTGSVKVIELDGDLEEIAKEKSDNLQINIRPDQLAYIIYTSGSTGRPKGVLIEHYNVVRLFKTEPNLYDFNENDVWTMFHSFCFDFSVWEMYGALFYGGKVVIVPKDVARDTLLFAELLQKEKVTILNQTPSAFYNLQ
jgi:non-ribosomal peptide synthetase component F/acyl carrier protein